MCLLLLLLFSVCLLFLDDVVFGVFVVVAVFGVFVVVVFVLFFSSLSSSSSFSSSSFAPTGAPVARTYAAIGTLEVLSP